jgi:hypothetical protein
LQSDLGSWCSFKPRVSCNLLGADHEPSSDRPRSAGDHYCGLCGLRLLLGGHSTTLADFEGHGIPKSSFSPGGWQQFVAALEQVVARIDRSLPAQFKASFCQVARGICRASPADPWQIVRPFELGKRWMRSKSQTAWETAARCATLAQEADDPQEREHYARLRDAWITLAKRCEPYSISDVTEK